MTGAGPLGSVAPPRSEPARPEPGPDRPHVVAWNLTRRCNLACAHCYISAGSWHGADLELPTHACLRIVDEILAVSPGVLLILSGGEPLLREDLEAIARRAVDGGATVVVGTNGTRLSEARIASLAAAGVTGFAVSVDSLDPRYHDRFRHGAGSLVATQEAIGRLRAARLDFIVQSTVTRGNRHELAALADWAAAEGAVAFNVYFVVATGRAEGMAGLAPAENEAVLAELVELERRHRGRMMVRSKCQPQIMRHVYEGDGSSPLLQYATRCPCGVQYCRITPEGQVTPCPYLPVVAGDLTTRTFGEVWRDAPVFAALREGVLGGKCGRCGYREICGGCRARAWAESGDLLGPDASCAYEPVDREPVVPLRRRETYGMAATPALPWSAEAEARMARVPSFVRGVVTARVERFAVERGYPEVTPAVLEEVRTALPVDFSKARPFFLGKG